jgi:hypothetical protein
LVNKEYKNVVIAFGPLNETGKFNNTKTIHACSPSEDKDGAH